MHELIKKIEDIAKQDIECMAAKGYDHIDRKCFGEAVDVLKDAMQMKYFAAETMKACLETEYMKEIKIPNKIHEGELTERMLEEYDSNPDFGVMGNGRYGYRGRAANGRFVHRSGRGRSAGYTPYLHIMPEMDEYDGMYDEISYPMTGYRMGYTSGRNGNYSGNMSNTGGGSDNGRYRYDGMNRPSRYGESYDRMSEYRRHYTESKNPEDKKHMEEYMKRYAKDFMDSFSEVKADADPAAWQALKQDMVKFVQSM